MIRNVDVELIKYFRDSLYDSFSDMITSFNYLSDHCDNDEEILISYNSYKYSLKNYRFILFSVLHTLYDFNEEDAVEKCIEGGLIKPEFVGFYNDISKFDNNYFLVNKESKVKELLSFSKKYIITMGDIVDDLTNLMNNY